MNGAYTDPHKAALWAIGLLREYAERLPDSERQKALEVRDAATALEGHLTRIIWNGTDAKAVVRFEDGIATIQEQCKRLLAGEDIASADDDPPSEPHPHWNQMTNGQKDEAIRKAVAP